MFVLKLLGLMVLNALVFFGIGLGPASGMLMFVFVALSLYLYFAPSFYAAYHKHKNVSGVVALNLFLGWTAIGWVTALVWSMSKDSTEVQPRSLSITEPPAWKKCPYCAEEVRAEAIKCKHCQSELAAAV